MAVERPDEVEVGGGWVLQDAKARFGELVRRVHGEGAQHVTVHGRDEVVVIAAEEYRRLQGDQTGSALISAIQASPCREVEIAVARGQMPVRDVDVAAPGRRGPQTGHAFSQPDLTIDAIAAHCGLTVVSRDVTDFQRAKVSIINPWSKTASLA